MARTRRATGEPTPAALPPERRTVGQLVAESIRSYGSHFARALPLGLVVAGANQASLGLGRRRRRRRSSLRRRSSPSPSPTRRCSSAVADCRLRRVRGSSRSAWGRSSSCRPRSSSRGSPWPESSGSRLPGSASRWRSSRTPRSPAPLRRGLRLGRVDYLHAAGSLATLVILFVLARLGLALLLESQADNTVRVAVFLADGHRAAPLPRRGDPVRGPGRSATLAGARKGATCRPT